MQNILYVVTLYDCLLQNLKSKSFSKIFFVTKTEEQIEKTNKIRRK